MDISVFLFAIVTVTTIAGAFQTCGQGVDLERA
jgi:hypothetical protein